MLLAKAKKNTKYTKTEHKSSKTPSNAQKESHKNTSKYKRCHWICRKHSWIGQVRAGSCKFGQVRAKPSIKITAAVLNGQETGCNREGLSLCNCCLITSLPPALPLSYNGQLLSNPMEDQIGKAAFIAGCRFLHKQNNHQRNMWRTFPPSQNKIPNPLQTVDAASCKPKIALISSQSGPLNTCEYSLIWTAKKQQQNWGILVHLQLLTTSLQGVEKKNRRRIIFGKRQRGDSSPCGQSPMDF